jgi:hypothetical protein
MLPKPASNVLRIDAAPKSARPQPPDSNPPVATRKKRIGSVLEQNKDQMFLLFRHGSTPRYLSVQFETPEREIVGIINERFDQRLRLAAMRKAA